MKKLFTLLLALAASVGTMFAESGTCGENLTWDLTDSVLTISGTGDMTNWSSSTSAPWYSNRANISSVAISNGVTSIGNSAFCGCENLRFVSIPNSVTSICQQAFFSCQKLKSITIPEGVTYIGNEAFYYCLALESLTLPSSITYIGESAFQYCENIPGELIIPNSVTYLGFRAFSSCKNLTSIRISNSLTYLGQYVFSCCYNVKNITIPNSITRIGINAFQRCYALENLTIPASVTTIDDAAFWECTGLKSLTCYATTPPEIGGYYAFFSVDLSQVKLYVPEESVEAYKEALYWQEFGDNIEPIQTIYYNTKVDDLYYNINATYKTAEVIANPNGYTGDIIIPASIEYESVTCAVTRIVDGAFRNCSGMTSVTIPSSIKSIGNDAFDGCTGLTSVNWNAKNCANSGHFGSQVESFVFGNEVESIPAYCCANMNKLTSITIPTGITSIEEGTFSGCAGLTKLVVPNNINVISKQAFMNCSGLTRIISEAATPPVCGDSVFYNVNKSIPLFVPADGENDYRTADQWRDFSENIIPIGTIYSSVEIDGRTYNLDATYLTAELIRRYGVNTILPSIEYQGVTYTVTSIAEDVYGWDYDMTSVFIPATITKIGLNFFWCISLDTIVVEEGNPVYDSRDNCNAIIETATNTLVFGGRTPIIPDGITRIGENAYCGHSCLNEIVIPSSVTSIGANAFYYCGALRTITIGKNVSTIEDTAFESCFTMQKLTNYATTPQVINSSVFSGVSKSECTLYVPKESVELYKAADVWKEFGNIVGIDVPVEPEPEPEPVEGEYNILYVDNNSDELHREMVTLHVPVAPTIEGFTFVGWQASGMLADGIVLQAVYEANEPTSAPAVYTNPANPAQKLIRNGKVYILSDGKTYTITGQTVK